MPWVAELTASGSPRRGGHGPQRAVRPTRRWAAGREDRVMAVYTSDPPERLVAGTVGQPGEGTFYLQASGNGGVTSVALEKVQVSRLAERLDELLDDELRNSGGQSSVPAAAPVSLADDGPLDLPLLEEFRVGVIALAWDAEMERVVIEAQEESETPVEYLSDDVPEDGPGVLRVRITAGGARAVSQPAPPPRTQGPAPRPPCWGPPPSTA